jgi:hypothetical protein
MNTSLTYTTLAKSLPINIAVSASKLMSGGGLRLGSTAMYQGIFPKTDSQLRTHPRS